MKRLGYILIPAILSVTWGGTAQAELTDPFEILQKYYETLGGIETLKAKQTSHVQGNIVIKGTGLEGTFEEWSQAPIKKRQNVDLGIITQMSGDNGEYPWTVDHNGKLQIVRDEIRLQDRIVDSLLGEFEHLNRDSEYFTLSYEGIDTAAGYTCYALKIINSISGQELYQFIDTTDFLMKKQVTITPGGDEQHTIFSDYRQVGDILMSYRQVTRLVPTGMIQQSEITLAEVDIAIDPRLFEPLETDIEDYRFVNGKKAENIPFEFIEEHIYLPVEVGGKTRLWVLDTGASATVIMRKFCEELGLEITGKVKGKGAANVVDVSFTTMPAFSLPGLEFDEQKAAVVDLNWLFDQWIGRDIAGILGYDFLSRLVIKVDYANELLSFYHPDSFMYEGPGVIIEAPLTESGSFHLPVTIDGIYGGMWHLDLGAGGMSFHYPYAQQHDLLSRPGVERMGFGAGGSRLTKTCRFETIEFAGFTLPDPLVSMPVEGVVGAFASEEITGNIGNTLLRHFVLYLDYHRGQVIVEKGGDFGRSFPEDHSGMQVIQNENGRLEVLFVAAGTPAAKAGFEAGDIILSVNGIGAENLGGIVALKKLLRETRGTTYKVVVDRGGSTKRVELTLRDLFE